MPRDQRTIDVLPGIAAGAMPPSATWSVVEQAHRPERRHHAETILTIGNGYLCTRGSLEEAGEDQWRTTFAHGVFDPVPLFVTEPANLPDWTQLTIDIAGERFDLATGTIGSFRRELDLRDGTLRRIVEWTSPAGLTSTLHFERFASLADEHLVALRVSVAPQREAHVRISSTVGCYAPSKGEGTSWVQHTRPVANLAGATDDAAWDTPDTIGLHVRTMAGAYDVAVALRHEASETLTDRSHWDLAGSPALVHDFTAGPQQPAALTKVGAYQTSRDGDPDVAAAALRRAGEAPGYDDLLEASRAAWAARWEACDIEIEGDDDAQLAVRFSMYHLIIAGPTNDARVNIGAKTLSGFGYRAHAFWDTEIFMLPFFIYTQPEIARNLLDYRWHHLPGARKKAAGNGCEGAQFPWESADTGEEVCPTWLPGPDGVQLVRIWTGDIELHISADIAYAAHQYWQVTGDDAWYDTHGADLILQTAQFWASRATLEDDGRYHLRDVIGPDEYHEHVDDNAYTNAFARWHLQLAVARFRDLRDGQPDRAEELAGELGITDEVLAHWTDVAERLVVAQSDDGLIEQFEGYFAREDVDLAALEPRTTSVQAILGIEATNRTQVLKQPDVLMLLFLLRSHHDPATLRRNYDYYNPRTDHRYGSSLGPSMSAIVAAEVGLPEQAYAHFMLGAQADLADPRGNADDGIHAASCGGTWQAVVLGFAGLRVTAEGWSVDPKLPAHWRRLTFRFTHRGQRHVVEIPNERT